MTVTPSIRLVAYPDRQGLFVFVAVPDERGRYVRTDRSVVLVGCPHCKAVRGEPCRRRTGYGAGTHCDRRSAAKRLRVHGQQDDLTAVDDGAASMADPFVIELPEPVDLPPIVIRPKILGSVVLIEPKPL